MIAKTQAESVRDRAIGHIVGDSVLWKQHSDDNVTPVKYHLYFANAQDRNAASRVLSAHFPDIREDFMNRQDTLNNHCYHLLYIPAELGKKLELNYPDDRRIALTLPTGGVRNKDTEPRQCDIEKLEAALLNKSLKIGA